jgi:hypothetical protein
MPMTTQNLLLKRNQLKASATKATKLAAAERSLADEQHLVAQNLECLAEDLTVQVIAVEAELRDAQSK